jgi:hypothetical protein
VKAGTPEVAETKAEVKAEETTSEESKAEKKLKPKNPKQIKNNNSFLHNVKTVRKSGQFFYGFIL